MKRSLLSVSTLIILTGVVAQVVPADAPPIPKEWESLDVPGLAALGRELRRKGEAETRKRLGAYVAGKYQAAAASGRVDWDPWLEVTEALGYEFPDQVCQAMLRDIQTQLISDRRAILLYSPQRLRGICMALVRLRRRDIASSVCATSINGSEKYKTASPETLYYLSYVMTYRVKSTEALKAARLRVVDHLTRESFADPSKLRAAGCRPWRLLSIYPGRRLPKETKDLWAKKLREAFVQDDRALPSLSGEDLILLADALMSLGDEQATSLVANWAGATTAWRSWEPQDLAWLARTLRSAGGTGRPTLERLAEHVAAKYLADKAVTRSVPLRCWKDLASHLTGAGKGRRTEANEGILSAETSAVWVSKLRAAFLDDPAAIRSSSDLEDLAAALGSLSDRQATMVPLAWMEATTAWQSWPAPHLARLASSLSSLGKKGATVRARVAGHVTQKYLADEKAVRSISLSGWQTLARHLAKDLTPEARRQ